jgi:hypothetical protein
LSFLVANLLIKREKKKIVVDNILKTFNFELIIYIYKKKNPVHNVSSKLVKLIYKITMFLGLVQNPKHMYMFLVNCLKKLFFEKNEHNCLQVNSNFLSQLQEKRKEKKRKEKKEKIKTKPTIIRKRPGHGYPTTSTK